MQQVTFVDVKTHSEVRLRSDEPAAVSKDALGDRRELALIAVERTRMPMVITNPTLPDNPIVLANAAFLALTGYPAEGVIGRNCRFLQGKDTDPTTVEKIRAAVATGLEISCDLLNYRKNGTFFWSRLFISPVLSDAGNLKYFFASQLDITEERRVKELEAAEHLLLREIEHRAKNSLALVQGIVRLSRAASVDEFSSIVQGRVDALSNAHSVLADGRWRDVPLERLLAIETDKVSRQVSLNGAPAQIASSQVQPLALVVHELVANATRFGGLSVPAGTLSILWEIDAGTILIEMNEQGGPPVPADRQPGFGTTIIRTIVERQLRGTIRYDWNTMGLRTVITLPDISTD